MDLNLNTILIPFPLTKEKFVSILFEIKDELDLVDKLYKLDIDIINRKNLIDPLVELLEKIFCDEDGWISYFLFDTHFGEDWKVWEKDDTSIEVHSPEELYDFLLETYFKTIDLKVEK